MREFKEEAIHQITEPGYSFADDSERLGVSQHNLYKWVRSIKTDAEAYQLTQCKNGGYNFHTDNCYRVIRNEGNI
ncbi:transposase [Type-D symbiont of Plautia stali]|uniref:transposase n=1 Tax=Type-D symbiont of Plautia stali TaxID=1560356 RepID=UPI003F70E62C